MPRLCGIHVEHGLRAVLEGAVNRIANTSLDDDTTPLGDASTTRLFGFDAEADAKDIGRVAPALADREISRYRPFASVRGSVAHGLTRTAATPKGSRLPSVIAEYITWKSSVPEGAT